MKRNEKLQKNIHEKYEFITTIEQVLMMIDKWLEFKHYQPCPNDKDKTIQQVIDEIEKQNIDENSLDDLMMAQLKILRITNKRLKSSKNSAGKRLKRFVNISI